VDFLENARSQQRFDRLVLVADPRTLGRLRPALGAALEACVVAESPHNLTHLEKPDLERRLRELAGWML
jgi:protein required for attachment to host cells